MANKICPQCHGKNTARRVKPRFYVYLLFIISFLSFLLYTSAHTISLKINIIWLAIQISLMIWAMIERKKNREPVFYCRLCHARIPSNETINESEAFL